MTQRRVVEVFTNKSTEFMLDYGGSASWVMAVGNAESLVYCVCCRNDDRRRDDDSGDRPERRNEAFLVGEVSGIELVERRNNRDRYLIRFSKYAEVSVPDFRHGSTRNPVFYSDVEACKLRDLDIDSLEFKPMPVPTRHYGEVAAEAAIGSDSPRPLTIAEAKAGLALNFRVSADAIQIIITG